MSEPLEKQQSADSSEDWTEWEVIDVRSQSCSVSSPKVVPRHVSIADESSGSLVNIGVAESQVVQFDAEEKNGQIDLHEAYRMQQLRMQQEKVRLQRAKDDYERTYGNSEQTQQKLANITAQQQKDRAELANTQEKYDQVVQLTQDLKRQLNELRFQQRQVEQDRQRAEREKALEHERHIIKQRAMEEELRRQRILLEEKTRQEEARERQRQREREAQEKEKEVEKRRLEAKEQARAEVAVPVSKAVLPAAPVETWTCQQCGHENEESFRFCPQCCAPNSIVAGLSALQEDPARAVECVGKLGEGQFLPAQRREVGWVLKNKGKSPFALSVRLQRISEDTAIKVAEEGKPMDFHVAAGEELFVMVEVTAPPHPGRYTCFWQLIDVMGRSVAQPLEMIILVKREFSQKQEKAIKTIMAMGFENRHQVVQVLRGNKWNVPTATEILLTMPDSN